MPGFLSAIKPLNGYEDCGYQKGCPSNIKGEEYIFKVINRKDSEFLMSCQSSRLVVLLYYIQVLSFPLRCDLEGTHLPSNVLYSTKLWQFGSSFPIHQKFVRSHEL